VERICGICSYAHVVNFTQNVEDILDIQIPKRAEYIRTLFLELERLHSHFLWLGVAGHEIGFDTLFMYTWQDREVIQDLLEMISGNRVNYAMNTIGGVRRDISEEHRKKVLEGMDYLEKRAVYYKEVAINEKTILARTENVGILKPKIALKYSAVGPTVRASGITMDIRKDDPYASYSEIPFEVITTDTCDVLGRVVVRVLEVFESIKIIRYLMEHLPSGEIVVKVPRKIPAIAEMLKGAYLADVPIVVAAIDPCMGCMDRVLLLKQHSDKPREIIEGDRLRTYGIKWYKERGWKA
jgi:NADH-quinone oxidoreductase subunit D